jgi:hypothetical protein
MMERALSFLFGCQHNRTSFPLSNRPRRGFRRTAATAGDSYIVCLDCGREFPYSWADMRVVDEAKGGSQPLEVATR